jgi:hypothetical protein
MDEEVSPSIRRFEYRSGMYWFRPGRWYVDIRPHGSTLPLVSLMPRYRFVLYRQMRNIRQLSGSTVEIETDSDPLVIHRHRFRDRVAFETFVQMLRQRWGFARGNVKPQPERPSHSVIGQKTEVPHDVRMSFAPILDRHRYEFFYAQCYRGRGFAAAAMFIAGNVLIMAPIPGAPRFWSTLGMLVLFAAVLTVRMSIKMYGEEFGHVPQVRLTDHAAVLPLELLLSRRYRRVSYSEITSIEHIQGVLERTKLRITTPKGTFKVFRDRMCSSQDFEVFARVLMHRWRLQRRA